MIPNYRLRVDPWAAEYDGAGGRLEADEPAATVDPTVERSDWQAIQPTPSRLAAPVLAFVDGVRRIDCRFVVEAAERRAMGLFGSFAVGAASSRRTASISREHIGRLAAVGNGVPIDPVTLRLGATTVQYEPATASQDDPDAPLRLLQSAMRRAEAELAPTLLTEHDAVLLDGPLSSLTTEGPLIGYVKRLMRSYLPFEHEALLPLLETGQRTPLFRIDGAPQARWSWYQRIGTGRPIDTLLAGVVRCEASAQVDLEAARGLADLAALQLPRFASDALRDPRAPQNLFPIGALETHLRHRLGDPLLLRRALEAQLAATQPGRHC